jgi:hypothetical protein
MSGVWNLENHPPKPPKANGKMFKVGLFIAQSGFLRYTTQTQIP